MLPHLRAGTLLLCFYAATLLVYGPKLARRQALRQHQVVESPPTLPFLRTWKPIDDGLKIYIYTDLPQRFNEEIRRENRKCASSMFAAEVAIHNYLLRSTVRTTNPSEADLFFLPVYTTCRFTAFAGGGPDPWEGRRLMAAAVDWLSSNHNDLWTANGGRDHVFLATHDYATCFDYKRSRAINPFEPVSSSIILQTLGDNASPCYNSHHQIVIPPFLPVAPAVAKESTTLLQANWKEFLPTDYESGHESQSIKEFRDSSSSLRDVNCFFIGQLEWEDANGVVDTSYSGGIRQTIRRLYEKDPWFLIKHVTREGSGGLSTSLYINYLERSIFCLSPAGFAPWTKRFFEAIIHGCIPVVIADTLVLPFEDQLDYSQLVVRVSQDELSKGLLKQRLQAISKIQLRAMQSAIVSVRKAFLFEFPTVSPSRVHWVSRLGDQNGGNAFDYTLRELALKKKTWAYA